MTHSELSIDEHKAVLRLALKKCYGQHSKLLVDVQVQTKPKLLLRAVKAIAAGHLTLVPLTTSISHTSKTVSNSQMDLGVIKDGPAGPIHAIATNTFNIGDKKGEAFIVPFWTVKRVADSAAENMKYETKDVDVRISMHGSTSVEKHVVKIPVLVNSKPLAVGDELVLHESTTHSFAPEKSKGSKPKAARKN